MDTSGTRICSQAHNYSQRILMFEDTAKSYILIIAHTLDPTGDNNPK
jgi:hypothetical protein